MPEGAKSSISHQVSKRRLRYPSDATLCQDTMLLKIIDTYGCPGIYRCLFCCIAWVLSALSHEVEHLEDLFFGGCAVDVDVSYAAEEGEVYLCAAILLVVLHELVEFVILLASEVGDAVEFLDVLQCLAQCVCGEALAKVREVEFADESPGYGISVEARGAASHGHGLEGVA